MIIEGVRENIISQLIGYGSPGVASVLAAVTDTGVQQVITTGFLSINQPGRITATSGGVATDIKAVQVIVAGKDSNDLSITETLPIFTVNTATTVTGIKVFKKVTQVTIPAHDGLGATTSIGLDGAPAVAKTNGIMAALTDTGVQQVVLTGVNINLLDVPRNITATAGGTATDIKAIAVIVAGKDAEGNSISETLPVFTENTAGSVTGDKVFAEVTSITVPAHDGVLATTAVGFGEKLGIGKRLKRNTIRAAYLDNVLEGTAATVAFDATVLESNSADLNSALNSKPVRIEYTETPQA